MRRHILVIVVVLMLVPIFWWGYRYLGPHPVLAAEDKLGFSRRDIQGLRSGVLDAVTVVSGLLGIATFFRERRVSKKRVKK
jgi:uncharacterized membrane protein YqiK